MAYKVTNTYIRIAQFALICAQLFSAEKIVNFQSTTSHVTRDSSTVSASSSITAQSSSRVSVSSHVEVSASTSTQSSQLFQYINIVNTINELTKNQLMEKDILLTINQIFNNQKITTGCNLQKEMLEKLRQMMNSCSCHQQIQDTETPIKDRRVEVPTVMPTVAPVTFSPVPAVNASVDASSAISPQTPAPKPKDDILPNSSIASAEGTKVPTVVSPPAPKPLFNGSNLRKDDENNKTSSISPVEEINVPIKVNETMNSTAIPVTNASISPIVNMTSVISNNITNTTEEKQLNKYISIVNTLNNATNNTMQEGDLLVTINEIFNNQTISAECDIGKKLLAKLRAMIMSCSCHKEIKDTRTPIKHRHKKHRKSVISPADKTEQPVTIAPVINSTEAPATTAPVINSTEAPATIAPVISSTEAPATNAPVTNSTEAPVTAAPANDISMISPGEPSPAADIKAATDAPATNAPVAVPIPESKIDPQAAPEASQAPAVVPAPVDIPVSSSVQQPAANAMNPLTSQDVLPSSANISPVAPSAAAPSQQAAAPEISPVAPLNPVTVPESSPEPQAFSDTFVQPISKSGASISPNDLAPTDPLQDVVSHLRVGTRCPPGFRNINGECLPLCFMP